MLVETLRNGFDGMFMWKKKTPNMCSGSPLQDIDKMF